MPSAQERREALRGLYRSAQGCTRCPPLAQARHTVVFGAGDPDADLMFVGEAPGADEDRQGLPFVGRSGKLLDRLLEEIGLSRPDVFVTNVLRCRPPGNRDPQPAEIERCSEYLLGTVALVEPRVVCTLGNFATKLLRGEPVGITRLHGRPEIRQIGERAVRLLPLFHPAAALYSPANVELLRADFARIPELLALGAPAQPAAAPAGPEADAAVAEAAAPAGPEPDAAREHGDADALAAQLGLF